MLNNDIAVAAAPFQSTSESAIITRLPSAMLSPLAHQVVRRALFRMPYAVIMAEDRARTRHDQQQGWENAAAGGRQTMDGPVAGSFGAEKL